MSPDATHMALPKAFVAVAEGGGGLKVTNCFEEWPDVAKSRGSAP